MSEEKKKKIHYDFSELSDDICVVCKWWLKKTLLAKNKNANMHFCCVQVKKGKIIQRKTHDKGKPTERIQIINYKDKQYDNMVKSGLIKNDERKKNKNINKSNNK